MSPTPRRWILLRGLGRHAGHWGVFLRRFQDAFPHDDVETLDLAGNGTEVSRTSFMSIEDNVADLRERSKLLKKGPVSILAVSMGAMVAVAWADQHPGEVRELVLINTSDSGESYFFERLRPRNYLSIAKLFKQRGDLVFRERTLLQMTAGELPHLEKIAEKQAKLPATTPENFLRQIWASSRYSFPKSQPIRRIQFLVADGDSLVHPNCTKRLAVKWNAPIFAHPRADHDLTLIDPDWVIGRVRHFAGKSERQNETTS